MVASLHAQQLVHRAARQHLSPKNSAEVLRHGVVGLIHGRDGICLQLQAGHFAVGDAARDDPLEVAQVGRHVQREAMRGDALRDVDADGGDLLFVDAADGIGLHIWVNDGPDAGALRDALGHHAELAAGADEDLFEQADEVDGAEMRALLAG